MKDIFEQLKAEGQRCQPEFSESLHDRCNEAIDQIEASRLSKLSAGISSRNVPRSRRFLVWKSIGVAVVFLVGFVIFNSFISQNNTDTNAVLQKQPSKEELQAIQIPINPMQWEQLALEELTKSSNKPNPVSHKKAAGRSVGIYNSVKQMFQTSDSAKTLATSIMRQDVSMGNLLVKAGHWAQIPEDNSEKKQ